MQIYIHKSRASGKSKKSSRGMLYSFEESFDQLCKEVTSREIFELPPIKFLTKTDLMMLPYSSGTTGFPKGTMISHYNITTATQLFGKYYAFFFQPGFKDATIGFLPFFHIYGFLILSMALKFGVTVVTMRKFEPEKFLRHVQHYKVKQVYLVPPTLLFLAKNPLVSNFDLSSLQAVTVGAAPIGKDISEALVKRLPNIRYIFQGYGLTETSGVSVVGPAVHVDKMKLGSCGILCPNFQFKVIDTETGEEIGENIVGEICIKGPTVMIGYLNRPEATAKTIDSDGWLHTGDIGYYDSEGYFFVVDRLKELIKVKGFQVPPAELEDLLLSNPAVQDVAVVGIADDKKGEIPKAFVVRQPTSNITAAEIQKFVAARVAPYKQLAGGVEFLKQLPKSASGKILRRVLREISSGKNQSKL